MVEWRGLEGIGLWWPHLMVERVVVERVVDAAPCGELDGRDPHGDARSPDELRPSYGARCRSRFLGKVVVAGPRIRR